MVYLNYKIIAGFYLWMYSKSVHGLQDRASGLSCMFVKWRERQWRERRSLSPSPSLCPVKRFMNLSIGCAHVRLSVHAHTQRCQWAFMSMFKLSICNKLSLWGKWTRQPDSSQLKNSIYELSMDRVWVPTGAKTTNNVLTHKVICSLDETIYQIAYAKMAAACSECNMSTARHKTFNTSNYEDNGQKMEM